MKDYKTLQQIADERGLSYQAVRNWIDRGLPYKTEKVLGHKPRMVVDPKEVEKFLKLGISKN